MKGFIFTILFKSPKQPYEEIVRGGILVQATMKNYHKVNGFITYIYFS